MKQFGSSVISAFSQHPNSVGESYFQHLGTACTFAGKMLMASGACFVHAVFPFLCVKTGSKVISELHDSMLTNRHRHSESD